MALPLLLAMVMLLPACAAEQGMCTSKPGSFSSDQAGCSAPPPSEDEADHEAPRLYDISVVLEPGLVTFQSKTGLSDEATSLVADMGKGDAFYATMLQLHVHTGTHVDAPSHYVKAEWDAGSFVDKLDLDVLVGPALVVHVPSDSNITAEVLQSLDLPGSLTRLLFKTLNTDRGLMQQRAFASDYVGMTEDGAQWLVDNTQVKLVGIDYLSIASMAHLVSAHEVLLRKHVIPVEGLDLSALHPGSWYHLACLPLKIKGAEGAPARCVAFGPQDMRGFGRADDKHLFGTDAAAGGEGFEGLSNEDEL